MKLVLQKYIYDNENKGSSDEIVKPQRIIRSVGIQTSVKQTEADIEIMEVDETEGEDKNEQEMYSEVEIDAETEEEDFDIQILNVVGSAVNEGKMLKTINFQIARGTNSPLASSY